MPYQKADGTLTYVRELPNRALEADSYRIEPTDIQLALEGLEEVEDVAVWHTHPSGLIGPSQRDMVNRPPADIWMLVVSLLPDGAVATWF